MHNGMAVWNTRTKSFERVTCLKLYELLQELLLFVKEGTAIKVHIENPNSYKMFSGVSKEEQMVRSQGAGAVKQTYRHIVEFLDDYEIPYVNRSVIGGKKKISADAAMMVFGI